MIGPNAFLFASTSAALAVLYTVLRAYFPRLFAGSGQHIAIEFTATIFDMTIVIGTTTRGTVFQWRLRGTGPQGAPWTCFDTLSTVSTGDTRAIGVSLAFDRTNICLVYACIGV